MQEKRKLQWHPAFCAALRISLGEEMESLQMEEEHLLSQKPLQIDVLILKKLGNTPVRKSIGRIFRKHNIIEYKGPGDNLSVNDFYKVYGYACVYQSGTDRVREIDPGELTITFACGSYPREMIRHLECVRGMRVVPQEEGIYYLEGDPIPIQLLVTGCLGADENFWIRNLRPGLKPGRELREVLKQYEKHSHSKDHSAVMDLITRANWKAMEEEGKMCEALKELYEELYADELEAKLAEANEKGLNRGKDEGILLAKSVFQMSARGDSQETIARKCCLSVEQVRKILA